MGSYPTFSPLPPGGVKPCGGGSFLLHEFAFADDFPLRSGTLYAARTFLTHHKNASDELSDCAFSNYKSRKKSGYKGEFRRI